VYKIQRIKMHRETVKLDLRHV